MDRHGVAESKDWTTERRPHRYLQDGATDVVTSLGPTPTLTPTQQLQTWSPTVTPWPTATPRPTRTTYDCWVCDGMKQGVTTTPDALVAWRGVQSTCRELTSRWLVDEFHADCAALTAVVSAACECQVEATAATESTTTVTPTVSSVEPSLTPLIVPTVAPTTLVVEAPMMVPCGICPADHTLLNPNTTVIRNGTALLEWIGNEMGTTVSSTTTISTCGDVDQWGRDGTWSTDQCRAIQTTFVSTNIANDTANTMCICDDTVTLTVTTPMAMNRTETLNASTTATPTTLRTLTPTVTPSPTTTLSPTYTGGPCVLTCRDYVAANDTVRDTFLFFGLVVSCRQTKKDATRGVYSPDLCMALQQPFAQCDCAAFATVTARPTARPTVTTRPTDGRPQRTSTSTTAAPSAAPLRVQFPTLENATDRDVSSGAARAMLWWIVLLLAVLMQ